MQLIDYGRKLKQDGWISNMNDIWAGIAEDLECHPSLVKMWAYKQRKVSGRLAIPLEKATDGLVSRVETRPDLYPAEEY